MTLLEQWYEPVHRADVFTVNGCLRAEIKEYEAREVPSWVALIRERVGALVWLAMPCHDDHAPALEGRTP